MRRPGLREAAVGLLCLAAWIRSGNLTAGAQGRLGERVGPGDLGQRLAVLEVPVRPVAAGVHHTLGDPLVVENGRSSPGSGSPPVRLAPLADPQRVLVVGNDRACWVVSRSAPSAATWCVSPMRCPLYPAPPG